MIRLYMKKISGRLNYYISFYIGNSFPFYYVCEYPRSGGTWVAHMVADYLQISFPKNSIFPLGHSCVVHNHWKYSYRLDKPVYVVRDGRDVAVSTMYYAIKNSEKNRRNFKYYYRKFPQFFNVFLQEKDEQKAFKFFILDWSKHSTGIKFSWPAHVEQWAFRDNVICVKYEDFHQNCIVTLQNLLHQLGEVSVDTERLKNTVNKFSFEKQTGRKPGEANVQDNKRKGIIGDWKNYFDTETAKLFHQYAGDVLQKLAYEQDSEWYNTLK